MVKNLVATSKIVILIQNTRSTSWNRIDKGLIWWRLIPSKPRVPPLGAGGSFLLIFCRIARVTTRGGWGSGIKACGPIKGTDLLRALFQTIRSTGLSGQYKSASNHKQCSFVAPVPFIRQTCCLKLLIGSEFRSFSLLERKTRFIRACFISICCYLT